MTVTTSSQSTYAVVSSYIDTARSLTDIFLTSGVWLFSVPSRDSCHPEYPSGTLLELLSPGCWCVDVQIYRFRIKGSIILCGASYQKGIRWLLLKRVLVLRYCVPLISSVSKESVCAHHHRAQHLPTIAQIAGIQDLLIPPIHTTLHLHQNAHIQVTMISGRMRINHGIYSIHNLIFDPS